MCGVSEMTSNNVIIIAEIGNNHNGSIDLAKEMICSARDCGADIIKFQMRSLDELYRVRTKGRSEDLGAEYIQDLLLKYDLSSDQHRELFEFCEAQGVEYLCTPWDLTSLQILSGWGVTRFKIASADMTNLQLIAAVIETGSHFFLSTGMSYQWEVQTVVDFILKRTTNFTLMHCNSTYPAPFGDINLLYLKNLFSLHHNVGYSGHERGTAVSLGAVALGATAIERHFTFDRNMEGPDHAASLEPEAFKHMCQGIRELSSALGSAANRIPTQGELINRENLAKSVVAKKTIKIGSVIEAGDVEIKSPGQGLSPLFMSSVIGSKAVRSYSVGDFFYQSDVSEQSVFDRKKINFGRPWGVPVRYHDAKEFIKRFDPQFIEFHLSYNDLNLNPRKYLSGYQYDSIFVHCPELFAGSTLLDLCSETDEELNIAIKNLESVVEQTLTLKDCLHVKNKIGIITNIGGHSMDRHLSNYEKDTKYNIFRSIINKFRSDDYEILPQTMAPFPWHFGGQRYQNLFVLPEEIKNNCIELDLRVCLDLSHSKLACNYYGIDFSQFLITVAPFTAYIHFGDALGVNGEGLQIGDGEIDFTRVFEILDEFCPSAPFIPEIWQGHKDFGEGFKVALMRLNDIKTGYQV